MRKIAIFVVGLGLFLLTQNAYGLDWVYNGDYSGDVGSGLTVGTIRTGDGESDIQQLQISGAGTLLPSGYPGWNVNFRFNGATWDSYKAEAGNTGYYDVFAAVLSAEGYYWDLTNTNIHPLENNSALILGLDPFDPTPGPDNSYWGGTSYGDGVRDYADADADVILNFATDPAKEYYLTFFMQTMGDEQYPSWGTVTNLNVTAVPEPISTILFLSGGALMGGRLLIRRRRK